MDIQKSIKIRMYVMLIIGCGSVVLGLHNLNIQNDFFAMMNFAIAGISLWSFWRAKNLLNIGKEKTWRSYR